MSVTTEDWVKDHCDNSVDSPLCASIVQNKRLKNIQYNICEYGYVCAVINSITVREIGIIIVLFYEGKHW